MAERTVRSGTAPGAREGARGPVPWSLRVTPLRLILLVMAMIFLGEAAIMLLLHFLPTLPWMVTALLNASLLLVVLSPLFYFLYCPLKLSYVECRRSENEIAELSRETIRAVEEEKRRLAYDLHDEFGPYITVLQCRIEMLRLALPEKAHSEPAGQIDGLAEMVSQFGDRVRDLISRLRPPLLEEGGIVPALDWYVRQTGVQWPDLQIRFEADGCPDRLPDELEITLFRLCQEGLNNMLKHARARQVQIRLSCAETIELRVEDDGVGFDPEMVLGKHSHPPHFGFLAMRERVTALEGTLNIQSEPGRGTVITAVFPHGKVLEC